MFVSPKCYNFDAKHTWRSDAMKTTSPADGTEPTKTALSADGADAFCISKLRVGASTI